MPARGDRANTARRGMLAPRRHARHRAGVRVRPTNLIAMLAAPALLAAPAPFVAGWHWTLDLLACFPVQAATAALAAAVCLGVARRWRLATAYLLGGVVALAAVIPGFCAAAPPPSGAPSVRIAAVNLLRGNERSAAGALALVRERAVDVVFFSEVTPKWLDALQSGLPEFPFRHAQADPGYYGVALFSRWPLREVAVMPLGVEWAPALRAIVDTPHGALGVLGVHTPRPGGPMRAEWHGAALAAIPGAVAPLPKAHVVLGDFNSSPWNHGFRRMLAEGGFDAGTTRDFLPTWPSHLPSLLRVPIDHVLGSQAVRIGDAQLGPAFGSDHLPLFVTVGFAAR